MVARRAKKKKATKTGGKATTTAVAEKPAKKTKKKTSKTEEKKWEIIKPQWIRVVLQIIGISPLITHRFGETAQNQILAKQMGKAVKKKGTRNPDAEYQESLYQVPGREKWSDKKIGKYGIAGHSFKKSCVEAARYVDGLPMTYTRGCFFVADDVVPIDNIIPYNRRDVVRLPNGSADLRFRGCFGTGWTAKVHMDIDLSIIDAGSVFNLFNRAGMSVGVGDWRPQKNGSFGRFDVLSMKQVKRELPKAAKKRKAR